MKLANAARYFDREVVYDGYTAALLFKGQTSSFDDSSSSGATSRRRVLSTRDGTVPPVRGVVQILGEHWLLGSSNPDAFGGKVIRKNYGMKKSTGLVDKLTPGQACLGAVGVAMHAQHQYYKDMGDSRTNSDLTVLWNMFCPPSEAVATGTFFRENGRLIRARSVYPTLEGLDVAEADQYDADALQVATFTTNANLDILTDTMTKSVISTTVIQSDTQKFYRHSTIAEDTLQPGDRSVFVAQSAYAPKVGATFRMLDRDWRVLAVVAELDAWFLHVRRA